MVFKAQHTSLDFIILYFTREFRMEWDVYLASSDFLTIQHDLSKQSVWTAQEAS